MSFAGPKDPLIERGIAAAAARGIVMVAASGNAGPKSPPLYPAANANVIAVSATDAQDRLFAASNRGSYIAVAAPGVDVFLPAPDEKYQMTSGTSFSAAYQRPRGPDAGAQSGDEAGRGARDPDENRARPRCARPDDLFGAGEADAFAAVRPLPPRRRCRSRRHRRSPAAEKADRPDNASMSRALNEPPRLPRRRSSGEKSAANERELRLAR